MKRNFWGDWGGPRFFFFFYFLSDLRAREGKKKQKFSVGMCAIFMERILVHHPTLHNRTAPPTPRLFTTPFLIKIRKEEEEEEFLLLGFLWNFLLLSRPMRSSLRYVFILKFKRARAEFLRFFSCCAKRKKKSSSLSPGSREKKVEKGKNKIKMPGNITGPQ